MGHALAANGKEASPSPEVEKNKGPRWKHLWFDFTQQTTFHGVRYITQPTPYPIRRVFWILVTLGCLAGFLYVTIFRLIYLLGKPKAVNVEVIYAKTLDFPAVTVCNQNFFRSSKTFELGMYDQIDDRFRQDDAALITDIGYESGCREGLFDMHKGVYPTKFFEKEWPLEISSPFFATYKQVTLHVCRHICLVYHIATCNAFVYKRRTKSCFMTSLTPSLSDIPALEVVIVEDEDVDTHVRRLCYGLTKKTCDFETGTCEFYKEEKAASRWLRHSGPTSTPGTGPDHDHTRVNGFYMYVEPVLGEWVYGEGYEWTSLISPFIFSTVPTCLQLAYSLKGLDVSRGSLQVFTRSAMGQERFHWSTLDQTDEEWDLQHVQLGSGLFQVVIRVVPSDKQLGDMAIDDVTIGPCAEFVENCRRTRKGNTYIGNVSTAANGQTCVPWSNGTSDWGWYFPDTSADTLEPTWNPCRNPNNDIDGPWCNVWNGTSLEPMQCDIPYCECTHDQFNCSNNLCIHHLLTCNGIDNCGDNTDETLGCVISPTCSFEKENACGYDLDYLGPVEKGKSSWLRYRGQIRNGILRRDKTFGSKLGYFLYLDSGTVTLAYRERVSMSTPWVTDTKESDQCFSFYLYNDRDLLFPDAMGTLAIYQTFGRYNRRLLGLFEGRTRTTYNAAWLWTWKTVTIPGNSSAYYITIEARVGYSYYSDMAIDDAELRDVPCNNNYCREDQFDCGAGSTSCVPLSKVCDGHFDCENFADEDPYRCTVDRPSCEFTTPTMCGYRDDSNPDYNGWKKTAGQSYVRVLDDAPPKDAAKRLVSPRWNPYGESCLEFSYVPNRHQSYCLLHVFQEFVDNRSRSYTAGGNEQGPDVDWTRGYVTLNGSENMALTFEANCVTPQGKFDMQLTDISITPQSCEDIFASLAFDCEFIDGDTCGYLDVSRQSIHWISDPNGGIYASLSPHADVESAEAILLSPTLSLDTNTTCAIISMASRNGDGITTVIIEDYNEPNTTYRKIEFVQMPRFDVPIQLSAGINRLALKVIIDRGTGVNVYAVKTSPECPEMPDLPKISSESRGGGNDGSQGGPGRPDPHPGIPALRPTYPPEESFLPSYENNLTGYYRVAGHQAQDMFYRCHWGGTPCSPANFSSRITDFGLCHTFNSGEEGYPLVETAGTGSSAGLRLILNIEQYDYMNGPHNDAGLKIFLSAQDEVARVRDLGLAVGPGAHAFVAVKLSQTMGLEAPWGDCGEQTLEYSDTYTYSACTRECETEAILTACSCRDAYMPGHTPDYPPICNISTYLSCVVSNSDQLGELSKNCTCTEPCRRDVFETQVSYATLSKQSVNQILSSDLQHLKVNHLRALEVNQRADPEVMSKDLRLLDALKINYQELLDFAWNGAWQKDLSFVVRVEKALAYFLTEIVHSDIQSSVLGQLDGYKMMFGQIYGPLRESVQSYSQQLFLSMEKLTRLCDDYIFTNNEDLSEDVIILAGQTQNTFNELVWAVDTYSEAFKSKKPVYNSQVVNLISISPTLLPDKIFADENKCYLVIEEFRNNINLVSFALSQIQTNFRVRVTGHIVSIELNPEDNSTFNTPGPPTIVTGRTPTGQLISVLYDLLKVMEQIKRITSETTACLDEYYNFLNDLNTTAQNVEQTKKDLLSHLTLTDTTLTVDNLLDYADESEKLTLYQAALLETSIDFDSGTITKDAIANKFDVEEVSSAVQDIASFITKIQNRLVEPKRKIIQDVEDFTKKLYVQILQQELRFSVYFHNSYNDTKLRSMSLWKRPQANFEDSYNPREAKDIFQLGNIKKFTEIHSSKVLSELTDWYTRPLSEAINKFDSNLLDRQSRLTAALENMKTQTAKFKEQTVMGQNFIRENFIAVDVFFAQLKYERTEQIKAYSGDSFFGDVGGYMGLLLGGSVVSLIEFLDLIIHNSCQKARQRKDEHDHTDQEETKDFPMTDTVYTL